MTAEVDDPVQAFAAAQRRVRRRMVSIVLAVAGLAALVVGVMVVLWPGPVTLPAIRRPYLWKVTPPAPGVEPSYLFGTLHVGYGLDALPRSVLAAQDQSRVTVVESDLLGGAGRRSPRAPSSAERERLPEWAWRRLAARTGLPLDRLQVAPTSLLLGAVLSTALGRVEAMDRALQARAVLHGRRVTFLEQRSFEEVLNGVPPPADGAAPPAPAGPGAAPAAPALGEEDLLATVLMMIERPGLTRDALWQIATRYAGGDDGGCGAAGALGAVVGGLNQDWAAAIERHVAAGGAFVAIGCAHLDGRGSVVEALAARGLRVERVDR